MKQITDIGILILACQKILGMKLPVDIRMSTKPRGEVKQYAGLCDGMERKGVLVRHVLHINLEMCLFSEYKVADVIAHEMVHACMIEYGKFDSNKHHDTRFQNLCSLLEIELKNLGFELGTLYNPDTDTD